MKVLSGILLVALLGVSTAEAWPWSNRNRKAKLPKPIDSPVLRPKLQDTHKVAGNKKRHPASLQEHSWGSEMGRLTRTRDNVSRVPYLTQE